MKGFWEGIKGQFEDLANLVLHPIDTAKGLIELGKAFYDDPVGTAKMIGEALGEDWSKLTECGAYDRGKVIGNYANPVFMVKLATKLSKFGSVAQALKKLKIELGCASFAAGTLVATPNGRVAIESLQTGQSVLSRQESRFLDKPQPIIHTFGRTVDHYYLLETEYGFLEVTAEHPFWVQGKGWTEAKDIESEAVIAGVDGDELVISNARIDEPLQVYNFSVANTPNYFVGSGIWVHNAKCTGGLSRSHQGGLKETLARAGTPVPAGYQAHHLIPYAVAKDFTVMKHAAKDLIYSLNRPNNGIALPERKTAELSNPDNLPIHQGSHPDYNNYVREKLQELENDFKTGQLTDGQILQEIKAIEDQARADLLNHKIFLDKNDPLNTPKA